MKSRIGILFFIQTAGGTTVTRASVKRNIAVIMTVVMVRIIQVLNLEGLVLFVRVKRSADKYQVQNVYNAYWFTVHNPDFAKQLASDPVYRQRARDLVYCTKKLEIAPRTPRYSTSSPIKRAKRLLKRPKSAKPFISFHF